MLMKIGMDGDIIKDSTTGDGDKKQSVYTNTSSFVQAAGEGEMIADGALGDDERTETESLDRESKQTRGLSPPREPLDGGDLDQNISLLEGTDENPPSPADDNRSLNNSHSSNDGGTGNDSSHGKKKRRRRGKHKGGKHHRKYKPYHKLTWSERREADERETKRANLKREAAFKSGHPVAPYNTTQFLMEDHSKNEGISPSLRLDDKTDDLPSKENRLSKDSSHCSGGSAGDSDDEYYYDSPNDEEQFLAKDFSEAYDSIHVERLQKMTKDQLVKDYLELEAKVEDLEKQLKDSDAGIALNNNAMETHNGVEDEGSNSREQHAFKTPIVVDSAVMDHSQ